jgi:hypothetical protein
VVTLLPLGAVLLRMAISGFHPDLGVVGFVIAIATLNVLPVGRLSTILSRPSYDIRVLPAAERRRAFPIDNGPEGERVRAFLTAVERLGDEDWKRQLARAWPGRTSFISAAISRSNTKRAMEALGVARTQHPRLQLEVVGRSELLRYYRATVVARPGRRSPNVGSAAAKLAIALLAVVYKDVLTPNDFAVLYAPVAALISSASLEAPLA